MDKRSSIEPDSKPQRAPQFGEVEGQKLADLLRRWRAEAGLGAGEERQLELVLKALVKSRASDDLESERFVRLIQPYLGPADRIDDEKSTLIRRVKPLLRTRELTWAFLPVPPP